MEVIQKVVARDRKMTGRGTETDQISEKQNIKVGRKGEDYV